MDLNQRFTDEELLEQLNSSKEGYGNATETNVTSITEPVSIKKPTATDEDLIKQLSTNSDTDVRIDAMDTSVNTDIPEANETESNISQTQDDLYSVYNKKYPELFDKGELINVDGAKELGIINEVGAVPTGDVTPHISTRNEMMPNGAIFQTESDMVTEQNRSLRSQMSRIEKTRMDFDFGELSNAEEEDMVNNLIAEMPDENPDGSLNFEKKFYSLTGPAGFNAMMVLGKGMSWTGAAFGDSVEAIASTVLDDSEAKQFANRAQQGAGTFLEFTETVPVLGTVTKFPSASAKIGRQLAKRATKHKEQVAKIWARKLNVQKMRNNTAEEILEKANAAKEVAEQNKTISNKLIQEFEDTTKKIISTTDSSGNKAIDYDLARQVGVETAEEVTQGASGSIRIATGTDSLTQPIIKPDKLDALVAVTADLQKANPKAFDPNKKVIDNLMDLTIDKQLLAGDELLDLLNKYNLSFEDYILTVAGSGSEAGKVLNKLSQIKRSRPKNDTDLLKETKKTQGSIRQTIMRVENIRRGGLVSQVATASRNLTSGAIRAPLEGLGNVMDTALYNMSTKGYVEGGKSLLSPANWKDSFRHMRYMFDNPKETKEVVDFILEQPGMAKQYDLLFNNINEIQKATGRGQGGALDNILSIGEDAVDVLNTPNRWQEYLVRRGAFLGELERLTKREYGIDLMDTLGNGKIRDLLNDASTVRPKGARSFNDIVADATNKALDVTYAKQPDIPVFKNLAGFIVRNGLTVVMPFPRFMFNSMELMGQYAGGAIIPLSRKVANIVSLGKVGKGKLTMKDRQRISRNIVGSLAGAPIATVGMGKLLATEEEDSIQNDISDGLLGMAAIGASYQYRASSDAPADYKQLQADDGTILDVTPQYPMRQFMYLGEATKRLIDGTFDEWFKAKEFNETFLGMNIRTGVGQSLINDVVALTEGSDLTEGESVGKSVGGALGNYLSTWAVPFAQLIEAQRALGQRGLSYKDVAKDPTFDASSSFMDSLQKPFNQRGFTTTAEEEEAAPKREFLFQEEKKRVSPISRVLFGLNFTTADSEEGEFIKELGFTDYELGSNSKVPSIKRFENKILRDAIPAIVNILEARQDKLKSKYENSNEETKSKYTEREYITADIKPILKSSITKVKKLIAEGKTGKANKYVRSMLNYRKLDRGVRKKASIVFTEKFNKLPNPVDSKDLETLVKIGKAFEGAIR
tara:strand:+ start:1425 stop:5042 length:3618 start_codon:yes stop_codon:yes gene_type:complete